ncbi:MAG: hypothetical protein KJZ78_16415 [Bryobacteraceae bacterium]|nr:hypothetical protein [Bryobacteraceae bacterium]
MAEAEPKVKPAIDGILDLFKQRPVVVLCDQHGPAQEMEFYSALIRDPRFAEEVGNVVVEFGGEASQGIIDRYVAGEDVPLTELRRVWTEAPGWVPGPTPLGYVNFFAHARAANLKLPSGRRIKVWLGEPKVDWSKINSYQDLVPYIRQRDDNYFRIIRDEILEKQKKTLLIIGSGHIFGPAMLTAKFNKAYPNTLAAVMPFIGYLEPECNVKFMADAKNWPVPALVGPIAGTRLKSRLRLPGCNFVAPEEIEKMKATPASALPPTIASVPELIHALINMVSGEDADAMLYLGPPETLTQSPIDPAIYLDPDYFKQQDRRVRCCTRPPGGRSLDWDEILQRNSVVPRRFRR